MLTHRERVRAAFNHQEPDRVPIDLGGTLSTTINLGAYDRLKERLGVKSETRVMRLLSQTAYIDEAISRKFDVDIIGLHPGPAERVKAEQLPDGAIKDDWGVVRAKPAGQGHYLDIKHPFDGEPTVADIARHRWPDPDDPGYTRGIGEEARRLRAETDYTISLTLPIGIVHQTQWLRGYENWMLDLAGDHEFFQALMERTFEAWKAMTFNLLKVADDNVDAVWYGDDVAFQNGPLCSIPMYREHIKPWHKKVFEFIRAHTKAKVCYHCCGSVYSLLPDFIEMGIDALNPVQVAAKDMDTARLKREFGKHVTFWGAIDTQRVLPRGTPQEVREEVRLRIRDLAPGGGFILAAVHIIQREVPPENVVAMIEAAREFGKYPIAKQVRHGT